MIVAIVGSRKYPDMDAVRDFVRNLPPGTTVVSGAGDERRRTLPRKYWGVDEHAEDEAIKCGLTVVSYPARWKRSDGTVDRGAGFARNGPLVNHGERTVAFWDGTSRGTRDSIDKARKFGKPVDIRLPPDRRSDPTPTIDRLTDERM